MGVSQARVSAMERGEVSSLMVASVRSYITALGGTVRIVASLDDTAEPFGQPWTIGEAGWSG